MWWVCPSCGHSLPRVVDKDERQSAWLVGHDYELIRLPEHEIRQDVGAAIRRRWTGWAESAGIDPGTGALA